MDVTYFDVVLFIYVGPFNSKKINDSGHVVSVERLLAKFYAGTKNFF